MNGNDQPKDVNQNASVGAVIQDNPSNKVVGATTAGTRALSAQIFHFLIRTPAKLFRPSRFDYLVLPRLLSAEVNEKRPWRFSTHFGPVLLFRSIKKHGWAFIPNQVLPPLLANSVTGIVLYTTYLTAYSSFQDPNNPSATRTFQAGFIAGAMQSIVATPLDAIYTRFSVAELLKGHHQNMWSYGLYKLKEIGPIGIFSGFGLSFLKESLGFGVYFSTFELIRNKGYKLATQSIKKYHGAKQWWTGNPMPTEMTKDALVEKTRTARILQTTSVLFAGASAALGLQFVQYPLNRIQKLHLSRLETLDITQPERRHLFMKVYYHSYNEVWHQLVNLQEKTKTGWWHLAYKGFWKGALSTVPGTSIGLLVFEIMRAQYTDDVEDLEIPTFAEFES